jgi:hypothetical protein
MGVEFGGRHTGSRNLRTTRRMAEMRAMTEKIKKRLGNDAAPPDVMSAYEFLAAIYLDETRDLEIRIDAAKALLPYETPKLQPIPTDGTEMAEIAINAMTQTEIGRRIAFSLAQGLLASQQIPMLEDSE